MTSGRTFYERKIMPKPSPSAGDLFPGLFGDAQGFCTLSQGITQIEGDASRFLGRAAAQTLSENIPRALYQAILPEYWSRCRADLRRLLRGETINLRVPTTALETGWLDLNCAWCNSQIVFHARRQPPVYDELTGLVSRNDFHNSLSRERRASRRQGFVVTQIDIDDFKEVNDGEGHSRGDQVLVAVAQRVRLAFAAMCSRGHGLDLSNPHRQLDGPTMRELNDCPHCVVTRIGGDELAGALMRVPTEKEAARRLEAIAEFLHRDHYQIGNTVHEQLLSIGYRWVGSGETVNPGQILQDADAAMYVVKGQREVGQRLMAHTPEIREVTARLARLRQMRLEAVRTGAFDVLYQPIVNPLGGRSIGFEALTRPTGIWRPDGTVAEEFAGMEDMGLTEKLAPLVLERMLGTLLDLHQAGIRGLKYAGFNVSTQLLQNRQYFGEVYSLLRNARYSQVTGSCAMEFTPRTRFRLDTKAVRDRLLAMIGQCNITIDDFGVGFGITRVMQQLHFYNYFKYTLRSDPLSADFVYLPILAQHAHKLGRYLIVVGVETEEQHRSVVELARAQRYLWAQGNYYAPPMGPGELLNYFRKHRS